MKSERLPEPTAIEQPADLTLLQNQQALDRKCERIYRQLLSLEKLQIKTIAAFCIRLEELERLAGIRGGPDEDGLDEPGAMDEDDDGTDENPLISMENKRPSRKPRGRK